MQKLIDELNIDCRIRSVPYPMLDMIARSMERLGRKSAKEPPLTHYGVSKLNFDFTLDITRAQEELGYQPVLTWMKVSKTAAAARPRKTAALILTVFLQQRFGNRLSFCIRFAVI